MDDLATDPQREQASMWANGMAGQGWCEVFPSSSPPSFYLIIHQIVMKNNIGW